MSPETDKQLRQTLSILDGLLQALTNLANVAREKLQQG